MRGLKARTLQAQCPTKHLAPKTTLSAITPKADKFGAAAIVRFVPIADIEVARIFTSM